MKYIHSLILIITVFAHVIAQENSSRSCGKYQNDVESSNLKGRVKSLIECKFSLNNTEWSSKSVSDYNKAGNIKKTYVYTKSGKLTHYSVNSYDKQGRKKSTNNNGNNIRTFSYSYDNKQNLVETMHLKSYPYINPLTLIMENTTRVIYNNFGKRDTVYSYYNHNEKLISKTTYQYDEKGNCIKETKYKPNRSLDWEQVYIYDEQNNKIQELKYNSTGTIIGKTTYAYDKGHNIILQLDSTVRFVDKLPAKVENNIHSKTFKYEIFDEHGNWLTKSVAIDGTLIYVTKREITYY